MKRVLISALLFMAIASCAQKTEVERNVVIDRIIIPKDEALAKLDSFLSEIHTKSSEKKSIQSVETYFGLNGKTSSVPDAYIVNFKDGKGFAVLGANTGVDDIVAVTDNGQIDALTLDITLDETKASENEVCEDQNAAFVKQIIENGINGDRGEGGEAGGGDGGDGGDEGGNNNDWDEDHPFPEEDNEFGGTTNYYVTRTPMLSYSWSQGDPYNTYCYNGNEVHPSTGCSTTAMAMIVAYNEFPHSLQVNGVQLNWAEMKSAYNALYLSSTSQNHVSLLMGSIFNFVDKLIFGDSTCIFPSEIKDRLEDFGYTNVIKLSDSSLTADMTDAISEMLRMYKPVFISAIPSLALSHAHSWVIDGAKYSSGTYLLHFNFGWNGKCNGYFSRSCLNAAKGKEYDATYEYDEDDDHLYNWHFRVITYDIPSDYCSAHVFF